MSSLRAAWNLPAAILRLRGKGSRKAIGLDLASRGEIQFCRNVVHALAARRPDDLFFVVHHDDTVAAFEAEFPELAGRVTHVPFRALWMSVFRRLDLYLTTEQFIPGPQGVYTATLFHGQPSKGVTFRLPESDPLIANDALFLYGPLQRQALEEHLAYWKIPPPPHLVLREVGYTKSDDLLSGRHDRAALLRERGLDPTRKTILYAPAFNAGASLREHGLEIVEALCALKQFNVLAKLPIDCLRPSSDLVATGGVNWFETIQRLENTHANFRLERALEVDPALACADILVTCVSSVSFEFLALRRPVIFFDTPRFYTRTLQTFFPGRDLSGWAGRTTVNAGREFGPVVKTAAELPGVIEEVIAHPEAYPRGQDRLPAYLVFNPGAATAVAVTEIDALLNRGARSGRPAAEAEAILRELCGYNSLRTWPRRRLRRLKSRCTAALSRWLHRRGYALTRTGLGFIDAPSTIAAARRAGVSICEYRESLEPDPRKRGRRDAIIQELATAGVLEHVTTACEIGAGTGQFLEQVLARAKPARYEVYETDPAWADFLRTEYAGRGTDLAIQTADGRTLRDTADGACDLVQAHAVFVYLPVLRTVGYLKECARVCRPGGCIVFDCFTERSLGLAQAETWLAGPDQFPVVLPHALLDEWAAASGLVRVHTFSVPYGAGTAEYFVWRKS